MNSEVITTIIASLGLGGLVVTIVQSVLASHNNTLEDQFKFKGIRYKSIMILMWTSPFWLFFLVLIFYNLS